MSADGVRRDNRPNSSITILAEFAAANLLERIGFGAASYIFMDIAGAGIAPYTEVPKDALFASPPMANRQEQVTTLYAVQFNLFILVPIRKRSRFSCVVDACE
mmetsp:Transcript_34435/g.71704  ORF Transcript_34435/g.71704 Transcript_34435/m.71704 type:complete len:103 (+) Transcript_34435:618-926(+)